MEGIALTNFHLEISSALEIFQLKMNEVLCGLPGLLCHVDDVLVHGKNTAEHETRLH